jgi:phage baseplate assembly protein W
MKNSAYRAPAFVVSAPGSLGVGLQVEMNGMLAMVSEGDLVRQAILLLLSTRPGERVMRPQYGCDLRPLLFLPNDHTTAGLAIHAVRQALRRWEKRAILVRLDAIQDPNDATLLNIELEYRVRGATGRQRIDYRLNLNGD